MGNLNQVKQMLQVIKSAGNPQLMMQQMLGSNPQYSQVMQYIQQNGGNAKQAFYALAKQQGVDPQQIINALM